MISNSPTVADGSAGTAPPAAGGIGSWFTRSNVGLLREVALLPVLILLIVVGTVTSPAFLTVSNFAGIGQQSAALGVVVVLFVVGWILARELYANEKIEDCVMSGRTNCVPIDTSSH